jgi:hypothetical protein
MSDFCNSRTGRQIFAERASFDELKTVESVDIAERFIKRKQAVQKMCNGTYKPLSERERSEVNRRLNVDDKYKLIFCYVPKAGCTSWKGVFLVMSGKRTLQSLESGIGGRGIHTPKNFRFLSSYKSSPEREKRLNTYTKFIVTREPLSRLVSGYVDKLAKPNNPVGEPVRRAISQQGRIPVTFGGFARYVSDFSEKRGSRKLNEHWRPQTQLCEPCIIDYDYYSTINTASEDADFILRLAGAPEWLHFPHLHTKNSTARAKNYLAELTPSLLQKVLSVYKDDYKFYGYDMP